MIRRLLLRFRYWQARLLSGYGHIRLQSMPEGTITVSVYNRGRWIPIIAEFKDLADGCTIDHSVSEIEILEHLRKPFYFEETDRPRGSRTYRYTRRRHRRNP